MGQYGLGTIVHYVCEKVYTVTRYNESLGSGQKFIIRVIRFIWEEFVMKWNFFWPQNSL